MEMKIICDHRKQGKYLNFSFCLRCGCTIIGKTYSVKSNKYKYLVEQSPLLMFETMKKYQSVKQRLCPKFLHKRQGLIKNLKVICQKFRFRDQSFYLGVHYLDIILSNNTTDVKMELVALCCLILAAKFDEIDPVVPILPNFEAEYENYEFTTDEIKKCEIFCTRALNYKLNYFTALNFLDFFIVHGYVFSDELVNPSSKSQPKTSRNQGNFGISFSLLDSFVYITESIYQTAKEVLSYFIDDNSFVNFSPLHIACCCVAISRESNRIKEAWSPYLEKVYGIKLDDFITCMNTIVNKIHLKVSNNTDLLTYVFNKQNSLSQKSTVKKAATLTYKTIRSNKLAISLGADDLSKLTLIDKKEEYVKKCIQTIHSPSSKVSQQFGNKTSRVFKKGDSDQKGKGEEKTYSDKTNFTLANNKYNNLLNVSNIGKSGLLNESSINNKSKLDQTFDHVELDSSRLTSRIPNRKRSLHINLALNPIHSITISDDDEQENHSKGLIIKANAIKTNKKLNNNNITINPLNSSINNAKLREICNIQKQTSYKKEIVLQEESMNVKENFKNYNVNNTVKCSSSTIVKPMNGKGNLNLELRSDQKPKLKNIYPNTNMTSSIGIILKKLNNKGEKK